MATEVIKKDGRKEPFDPEKIKSSITAAANLTDLPDERKNEVVEQVATAAIQMAEGREEISTSELKQKILSDLDGIEPSVSEAWKKYEEEKSRGTEETEGPGETAAEGTEEAAEGGESSEGGKETTEDDKSSETSEE